MLSCRASWGRKQESEISNGKMVNSMDFLEQAFSFWKSSMRRWSHPLKLCSYITELECWNSVGSLTCWSWWAIWRALQGPSCPSGWCSLSSELQLADTAGNECFCSKPLPSRVGDCGSHFLLFSFSGWLACRLGCISGWKNDHRGFNELQ